MSSKEEKSPLLESSDFARDAQKLFSLEIGQLKEVIGCLVARGKSFSTANISRDVGLDITSADSVRDAFLLLAHSLVEHDLKEDDAEKFFISLGCDPKKVHFLLGSIRGLSKEGLLTVNFLVGVRNYIEGLPHARGYGVEFNYTFLGPEDEGEQILVPVLRLDIDIHSHNPTQNQVARIEFSPNEFETFILVLQEWLKGMSKESVILKSKMGKRFESLVGEING